MIYKIRLLLATFCFKLGTKLHPDFARMVAEVEKARKNMDDVFVRIETK